MKRGVVTPPVVPDLGLLLAGNHVQLTINWRARSLGGALDVANTRSVANW